MAERNEPAEAPEDSLDRIEAALDRIANGRLGHAENTEIAARLDGLITRLRDALAIAAG